MSSAPAKRRRLTAYSDTDDQIVDISSDCDSDCDADCETIQLHSRPVHRKSPEKPEPQQASTSRQLDNLSQSSDEQESNDDKEEKGDKDEETDSSLETCRLRHGLNEDCLCEIFQYLGVYDLIQLCELDIYYQNLIVNWVIGKKLINFTKMEPCWTTNRIFQVFGKTMRMIKIAEENTLGCFERFLNFINQCCSVGTLTEMELRFSSPTAPVAILEESMPFFSNLRKLVLNDNYSPVSYKEFLAGISTAAPNLTHLTLEGVNVKGEWLLAGGMENLKQLRFHTSKRRSISIQTIELAEFLRTKSKLELFSYIGYNDILPVVDALTEYCPQLRVFVDFHLESPYRRDPPVITNQMKQRYNFVRLFGSVTTLGITSYALCGSDLFFPLVKMASQNKVEELRIYTDRDTAKTLPADQRMHFVQKNFAHFSSLKAIELQMRSESSEQWQLEAEFICEFISKQHNIKKFTVRSEQSIRDIYKIIDMAPNLNTLSVAQVKMKYLPVEMRKIYKSIRKRRSQLILDGEKEPPPFHVVVNEQQWRELQVYKEVGKILTTTIENTDRCQTFKVVGP